MGETGTSIVKGFRDLRRFCNQVSLLFQLADDLVGDDWEATQNKAVGYTCGSFDEPEWWLPTVFSTYYKHNTLSQVLPYIAVLLDDFEHDPSRVNEAILTAGWIDYDGANKTAWESLKETKVRPFYLCLSHLWIEGSEDNGTLYSRDPKQLWDYEAGRACKVSTFAYPLDSITSPEILKEKVVQRLLDEICREPASSESRSN